MTQQGRPVSSINNNKEIITCIEGLDPFSHVILTLNALVTFHICTEQKIKLNSNKTTPQCFGQENLYTS